MYPKKTPVDPNEKRERDKLHRREQMKSLLISKFQGKYSFGSKNREERDKIITREVNSLVDSKICSEKHLVELDKKLSNLFDGNNKSEKSHNSKASRHSRVSAAKSGKNSDISKRSAFVRAGADILSREKEMNRSGYSKNGSAAGYSYTASLNRSLVGPKAPDEWDNLIMNDVKKYEQEQQQTLEKRRKMKQQIMNDLNKQIRDKEALKKKSREEEINMEKKRQNIHHQQEKLEKQKELLKKMKNDEERKIMETQIAELEHHRKFEKHNEKLQAEHEKEQVLRELEDDLEKQKMKKKEYIEVCQRQYKENMELKESLKKREIQRMKEDTAKKNDMFGDLFEEKTHVSYELAARNQKKFDALTKILERENEKKNRARNYTEFEEGDNKLDK